ncbi:MAG: DotA/TraY family protein [Gammaproteobacteria bacterium]|nr:DotA/TraY family protein [Gammaproteobacteria bacterium]
MYGSINKSTFAKMAVLFFCLLATQDAWAIYTVDPSDKSFEYLRYVFGNIVNVIINQDGPDQVDSILGAISQVLNLGMLAFTGFIIAYNALTGVLNSARGGVVLGKVHSTMWIPFRMVIALFFVFPWTAGYSTMQVAIIWLAGQGIGLANEGWNASLDFIESTGSLYPPIVQLDEDAIALTLLESRVCMHGINYADGRANIVDKPIELVKDGIFFNTSINPNEVTVSERPPTRRVSQRFTSAQNYIATKAAYLASRFGGHPNGVPRYYGSNACGELNLEFGEIDEASGMRDAILGYQDNIVQAYSELDVALDPLARSIVEAKFIQGSPDPDPTLLNTVIQTFRADYEDAITTFVSDIATVRVSKWGNGNPDQAGSAIGSRDAGWISAGAWYWDIQRINAETQKMVAEGLTAELKGLNATVQKHDDFEQIAEAFNTYTENRIVIDSYTGAPVSVLESSSYSEDNLSLDIVSYPINFALGKALAHPDPVSGLADLGRVIIGTLEIAYVTAAIAASTAEATDDAAKQIPFNIGVFATSLAKSGLSKLLALIIFIGVLMLPIAMLLAFYLPATPLVIWLLGVAGWVVLLIEAIFAAPLWAASHAMPEGDGFVGSRAQAGYMVMLSLLLRPILMLAGFFASMPLMIIMGKVTLLLFYPFMTSMIGDSLTGIMSFIGIMAVFTGLIIQIAHRAYGLIHEIPDKIFRFIGGGTENLGEASNERDSRSVFIGGAVNVGRSVKTPKKKPPSATDKELSKGT